MSQPVATTTVTLLGTEYTVNVRIAGSRLAWDVLAGGVEIATGLRSRKLAMARVVGHAAGK